MEQLSIDDETTTNQFTEISVDNINANILDGALQFSSLEDFAFALQVMAKEQPEKIDAWASDRGFSSWGHAHRNIQAMINADPNIQAKAVLSPDEIDNFYFDDEQWLHTYAADKLISELMNTEGIVYVEGELHHFHKDYHLRISDPTPSKFEQAKRSLETNYELGIRVYPREVNEYLKESFDGQAKESKYFSCPFQNQGLYVWGHRKEETIDGDRNRIVVDLHQNTYSFGGTDNRTFSYIAIDIENRRKTTWQWVNTFPDFEFGTLESGSNTGVVSSGNVEQSLKVDRFIRPTIRRADGSFVVRTARSDFNVTMDPVGWAFREVRMSESDAYFLMDNVISTVALGNGEEIVSNVASDYGFRRGKISANWLNRSATMDIQLGCQ